MSDKYVKKVDQIYRINDSRIALDSIIYQFRQGRSPEAIQDAFPALSLGQVYGAIAYYLEHQAELDQCLAHNEATEEEFSREVLNRLPVLFDGLVIRTRPGERLPPRGHLVKHRAERETAMSTISAASSGRPPILASSVCPSTYSIAIKLAPFASAIS